jgi:hypothetical protein
MRVIALSGGDGGNSVELPGDKDIHIGVPHESPSRIQELYILILHCLCDATDCFYIRSKLNAFNESISNCSTTFCQRAMRAIGGLRSRGGWRCGCRRSHGGRSPYLWHLY